MAGNSGGGKKRSAGNKGKGGGTTKGAGDCDLSFEVQLSSVRATTLQHVVVGTVLDVDLISGGDGFEAVVCRRHIERDIVGALTAFEGLSRLMDCIRRGHKYVADVILLERATCLVRVRRST